MRFKRIKFTKRIWPKWKWLRKPMGKIGWRTGCIGLVVLIIGGIVCAILNSSGNHFSTPKALNFGTETATPTQTSQALASPTTSQVLASPTAGPSGSPTPNDLLCQGQDCEGKSFQDYGGCTWPYTSVEHVMVGGADPADLAANIFDIEKFQSSDCQGAKRIVVWVPAATYDPRPRIATATSTSYYRTLDVGGTLPGGAKLPGGQAHIEKALLQPGDEVWDSSMSFQPVLWDVKGTRSLTSDGAGQSGETFLSF